MKCFAIENHPADSRVTMDDSGIVQTLSARMGTGGGNVPLVLQKGTAMNYWTRQSHSEFIQGQVASALKNRDYKDFTDIIQEEHMEQDQRKYVLRRLTPVECARLQGFPDWWCDGANGSDSAQYKLWGNGLALPCACDCLGRIAEELRNNGREA